VSSNRRGFTFWLSAWWPVVAGITVIAVESTQYFGADRTSHPLRILFEALFGPVSNIRWEQIHHYIRKSGHFLGYGALGLTWLRAWWMTLSRFRFFLDVGLAIAGTALVASGDEWHQTFLPNRTGTPWDVALDCCGALVMQWVAFMVLRRRWPGLLDDRA
jgi:VanZ family protein